MTPKSAETTSTTAISSRKRSLQPNHNVNNNKRLSMPTVIDSISQINSTSPYTVIDMAVLVTSKSIIDPKNSSYSFDIADDSGMIKVYVHAEIQQVNFAQFKVNFSYTSLSSFSFYFFISNVTFNFFIKVGEMIRIRGPRVLAANRTFSSLSNEFELKIVALTSVEFNISGILNSLNTFRYQFTSIEAAHKCPHFAIISKVFEFLITYLNHLLFFPIIFHFVSFRCSWKILESISRTYNL